MFCPYCGNPMEFVPEYAGTNVACPHCGGQFTMPGQPIVAVQQQFVSQQSYATGAPNRRRDNVAGLLAAILSLFVPGLGQMCQGRIAVGMLFLIVVLVGGGFAFMLPDPLNLLSLLMALVFWLFSIVHAALS